jgi:glutathione S-transferase
MKRDAPPRQMSPYGDSEAVLATLDRQLAAGPYLLGERFSAADVLWGMALGWTTAWKLVPETPAITAYLARINARPAMARAKARDAELAAAQAGAA